MKRLILFTVCITISLVCFAQEEIRIGAPAPRFFGSTTDDSFFYAPDVFGTQPVVLSFFATFCEPCRQEMPELLDLVSSTFPEAYLLFIGIDPAGSLDAVAEFARDSGVTENVLFDRGNRVMNMYEIEVFPTTIIIDTTGNIAHISTGYTEAGMAEIERVLEEVCR
ncbi:MAG: TlpA family protein disulfide reductase [Spirochaetia bacterium]